LDVAAALLIRAAEEHIAFGDFERKALEILYQHLVNSCQIVIARWSSSKLIWEVLVMLLLMVMKVSLVLGIQTWRTPRKGVVLVPRRMPLVALILPGLVGNCILRVK